MEELIKNNGKWVADHDAAMKNALENQKDANAEILQDEGEKYARIAAFDAAMALGANATADERKAAAAAAAQAAQDSWGAAMTAVEASDAAATEAMRGNSQEVKKDQDATAKATKDAWNDALVVGDDSITKKAIEAKGLLKIEADSIKLDQELIAQATREAWATALVDGEDSAVSKVGTFVNALKDIPRIIHIQYHGTLTGEAWWCWWRRW